MCVYPSSAFLEALVLVLMVSSSSTRTAFRNGVERGTTMPDIVLPSHTLWAF